MTLTNCIRLLCFCLLLAASSAVRSQNYFKQLQDADKYERQKIARFPGGDILIGDSYLESQRTGKGGKVFATRIDHCGNQKWSYSYERTQEYLELRDVKINDAGEVFLYGSAYIGLDELIFLLKLSGRGQVMAFRLFEPETVDHFTLNIDIQGNRVLAYGLLLDFNTRKLGFVAVFDNNLNFQWGKKFTPFESAGAAIFAEDQGFLCRSGQHIFRLDGEGSLRWAYSLAAGVLPVAGPVEVSGGYVFEAQKEDNAFFYKLDKEGKLVWKTDQFPSTKHAADIEKLADGNLLAIYSEPGGEGNHLCYLVMTPGGEIIRQKRLNMAALSFQTGSVYQSVGKNNIVTVAGNRDEFSTNDADVTGFLMQFSLATDRDECFQWQDWHSRQTNNIVLTFMPLDTTTLATSLRRLEDDEINAYPFDPPLREICEQAPGLSTVQVDTTLSCEQDWLVTLPAPEFTWEDNVRDNPRLLRQPGLYRARSSNCDKALVYEYHLEKPACACKIFLPNAFSPNGDGVNDRLELFSDCTIVDLYVAIYNRWGDQVFVGNAARFWDGAHNRKPAPPGLYAAVVRYQVLDEGGVLQQGTLTQQVTLVR